MGETISVGDADDPRVSDFRRLNDQAARREMEGDEYFLSEGWVSIDRLIDSGSRLPIGPAVSLPGESVPAVHGPTASWTVCRCTWPTGR